MTDISKDRILAALEWRYATKAFDPARKIPADIWATIEKSLVLTPSSYGLQPYRFLILTDPEVRARLLPHAWGQRQVVDCSHFVVFAARTEVTPGMVQRYVERISEVRGMAIEALNTYRDMMLGDIVHGPRQAQAPHWAARQVYIALGNLLTTAALLEVDACPMEGFVPEKFDEVLQLKASGFTAAVACALGYRTATDHHARARKVRLPESDLIQRI